MPNDAPQSTPETPVAIARQLFVSFFGSPTSKDSEKSKGAKSIGIVTITLPFPV